MAEATAAAGQGFKPVNEVADKVGDGDNEATSKRSSDEANNEGASTPAKKQKATPKAPAKTAGKAAAKKGTAKKTPAKSKDIVKEEASDEGDEAEEVPGKTNDTHGILQHTYDSAATPASKGKKAAAKGTKTPVPATPKHVGNKVETASPRGIPKCWDEAEPADRMLVKLKDQGKPWGEIREMWKTMTGEDTGKR